MMGTASAVHFSVGHHFVHDIIFFLLGYEIEKKFYNLHVTAA